MGKSLVFCFFLTYSLSAVYVYLFLLPDFLANKGHHIEPSVIDYCTDVFVEPAVKEPSGLDRQDGKRPDGLTLIPWHGGRSLLWDVTVVSPLAASYVDRAATDAGTVADMAATRKTEIFSIQVRAYSSRKSGRLQFHNSELYFRTRPPNLRSHKRCERDFVLIPTHFCHATTLQLRAFARHSAS